MGFRAVSPRVKIRAVKLLSAAVALTLLAGCGGGDDCGQDVGPPRPITATQSPYELSSLMSDLSIGSVRWLNATTGESGVGSAAQASTQLPSSVWQAATASRKLSRQGPRQFLTA